MSADDVFFLPISRYQFFVTHHQVASLRIDPEAPDLRITTGVQSCTSSSNVCGGPEVGLAFNFTSLGWASLGKEAVANGRAKYSGWKFAL